MNAARMLVRATGLLISTGLLIAVVPLSAWARPYDPDATGAGPGPALPAVPTAPHPVIIDVTSPIWQFVLVGLAGAAVATVLTLWLASAFRSHRPGVPTLQA